MNCLIFKQQKLGQMTQIEIKRYEAHVEALYFYQSWKFRTLTPTLNLSRNNPSYTVWFLHMILYYRLKSIVVSQSITKNYNLKFQLWF